MAEDGTTWASRLRCNQRSESERTEVKVGYCAASLQIARQLQVLCANWAWKIKLDAGSLVHISSRMCKEINVKKEFLFPMGILEIDRIACFAGEVGSFG